MAENSTHKHLKFLNENPPVKDPKLLLKIATNYKNVRGFMFPFGMLR